MSCWSRKKKKISVKTGFEELKKKVNKYSKFENTQITQFIDENDTYDNSKR